MKKTVNEKNKSVEKKSVHGFIRLREKCIKLGISYRDLKSFALGLKGEDLELALDLGAELSK